MEKQLEEKNEAEQNNELANEQISTLQDMLKQKTLELSDAIIRIGKSTSKFKILPLDGNHLKFS